MFGMRHFFSKKSGDQPRYHVIQFLGANLHLTIELISKAKERCPRRDAKVASKYRIQRELSCSSFRNSRKQTRLQTAQGYIDQVNLELDLALTLC